MMVMLEHLGEPYQVLSEGWCCGYPAFTVGDTSKATELARNATARLEALGVRTLVVSCAWGYRMFSREYSVLLGRPLGIEVLHATEFLEQQIVAGRLKLSNSWEVRATYHDPCQLGRRCGVFEPPRNLARSIPGLTLVEMAENREAAMCSGGGGGVAAAYPELATAIGSSRVEQAESTGAKVILTACPYCRSNLLRAIEQRGSDLQVIDIVEAVASASGFSDAAALGSKR
jgi:Fe-S oxidoreductase